MTVLMFLIIVVSVAISIPVNSLEVSDSVAPTVCITDGCMRGISIPDESHDAFLGIPYAKPPIAHRRFANPVPATSWRNTLDATVAKPDCIQKNVLVPNPEVTGSEDCLYLNVYRPINRRNSSDNGLLPVMVFIHGGGFFAGSASPALVGPQYFMENGGVVMVAMAYRLGVFGFLSTGDQFSTGNFGLKDQALALLWVKNNIRYFGGDNNQVTIFGISAGAASVHMHMMSPLSQGLFQKAIIMSGSAIAPYNDYVKNPLSQARQQASAVDIHGANEMNSKRLVEKLRTVDAVQLTNSTDKLKFWSVDSLTHLRLVVEGNRTGAFMVEDPKILWKNGHFKQIPWMTGVVQHEGVVRASAIVTNPALLADLNTKLRDLLPKLMEIDSMPDRAYKKMNDFYLNGTGIVNEANMQRFIDMFSDRAFNQPYYEAVSNYIQHADTNQNPVSLYRFNFKGPFSYSLAYTGTGTDFGVVHMDDTLYLFGSFFPVFPEDSVYANLTKTMVDFYVTFAKNGRPAKLSKDRLDNCTKSHRGAFCDYQEFRNTADGTGFEVRTRNDFDTGMLTFWDDVLKK